MVPSYLQSLCTQNFHCRFYIVFINTNLSQQERKKLSKQQIRRVWNLYCYNNPCNKTLTLYEWRLLISSLCIHYIFYCQLCIISFNNHLSQQERKKLCKQQIRRVWNLYYYNNPHNKFKTLYKWCLFISRLCAD